MKLDRLQLEQFDQQGYLFFRGLLDKAEVSLLQQEIPTLLQRQGPEVDREKEDSTTARLVYGAHVCSQTYKMLSMIYVCIRFTSFRYFSPRCSADINTYITQMSH